MKNSFVAALFVLSCLLNFQIRAATLNVGPGHQYSKIQDAIDAANNQDIILVHNGTYLENIRIEGKSITIVSENGPENTIIDGANNDHVVYFGSGDSELDGFTVQNGRANQGGGIYCWWESSLKINNCIIKENVGSWEGGGIYAKSSPLITNCRITNNESGDGGGIYCPSNSSPTISDCVIRENSTDNLSGWWGHGGGIYCDENSTVTISKCVISDNIAENHSDGTNSGYGGGIYCEVNSTVTITSSTIVNNEAINHSRDQIGFGGGIYSNSYLSISNSTLSNNTAGNENTTGKGGGIYCWDDATLLISDCEILNNIAIDGHGGGVFYWGYSNNIDNSTISGNEAGYGGGIYVTGVTMTNCIITGNIASVGAGGGIYGGGNMTNCTIAGNEANSIGGGMYCYSGYPTVINSILWNNIPNQVDGDINITYSDIMGGHYGEGNIDVNPDFEDAANGNFHLSSSSPCINQGNINASPEYDFEGEPRLSSVGGDNMPDLGADERYVPQPPEAPSNLTATAVSPTQINLTWQDNSDNEDGYRIDYFYQGAWNTIEPPLEANTESFSHTGLLPNTTYSYRVYAFNSEGNSDYSNTASATTPTMSLLPDAPTNLKARAVSTSRINLTWQDNSEVEQGFIIERLGAGGFGVWSVIKTIEVPNAETFSDTGLNSNTTYTYRVCAYNNFGNSDYSNTASAKTFGPAFPKTTDQDLVHEQAIIPTEFSLMQNSPNPFNPETQISFSLPQAEVVDLKIFNLQGQLIQTLVNNSMQSGYHTAHWNGKDSNGRKVADGIYFYVLQAGQFKAVKRMTLLK